MRIGLEAIGRVAVLSSLLGAGCGGDCTEMGCSPGLTIAFGTILTVPGEYTVSAALDEEEVQCRVSLPFSDVDDCQSFHLEFFGRGDITSDGQSESGAANFVGVFIEGVHSDVSLTIERDGTTVVSGALEAKYEDVEINGPGCGTCSLAEGAIQ